MRRVVVPVLGLLVLVLPPTGAAPAPRPAPAAAPSPARASAPAPGGVAVVRYAPPLRVLPLRVLRGFSLPAGPYGPGHRGVDLAVAAGATVVSAADGTVTFAGSVAGRGVVVVGHADGVRTTYEPVRPSVRRGATVRRGAALGTVTGRHGSCAPASCLHWGARRGPGRVGYLDPLLLLRPLGPVRLLPWR